MAKINISQKIFDEIYDLVFNYPSRHIMGLFDVEVQDIYSKIPNFYEQLRSSKYMSYDTCMIMDNGDIINYMHDVYKKIIFVLRY